MEEAKAEIARRKEAQEGIEEDGMNDLAEAMSSLNAIESNNRAKDLVGRSVPGQHRGIVANGTAKSSERSKRVSDQASEATQPYTISYAPSYPADNALARAASLDTRLAALELALGIDSLPLPSNDPSNASTGTPTTKPLLPTMASLERQITTLLSTSASSLEPASKQLRQLSEDTERLAAARKAAREAADEAAEKRNSYDRRRRSGVPAAPRIPVGVEDDPEQLAKLNALHGTLGTINSLAPILPSVLERLRSLRLIHTEAAAAGTRLQEVEERQREDAEDIKTWSEALERVEKVVDSTEERMRSNMHEVDGWVKQLEQRMKVVPN